jgi:hypothetical protein
MTEKQPPRVPLKGVEGVPPISRAEPITADSLAQLGFDECHAGPGDRFRLFRRRLESAHTIDAKLWPEGVATLIVMPGYFVSYAMSPADLLRQIEFIIEQTTATDAT